MQEQKKSLSPSEIKNLLLEVLSYEEADIDSEGKTFKKYDYQGTQSDLYRLAEGLAIKKRLISNDIKVSGAAWGGAGVMLHAGLTTNFSHSDIKYIYEQFQSLINEGIIAPGATGNLGPNLPCFHVTDYGKRVIEGKEKLHDTKITDELYNLFVSGDEIAWESDSKIFELGRCITEYTEKSLIEKYSKLGREEINFVKSFPCIFAYEDYLSKDAYIGYIADIAVRKTGVKITFVKESILSFADLHKLEFELDIGKWELNRTHWALKKVDLYKELHDFEPSQYIFNRNCQIDITKHFFDISFTFAGESRELVEQILFELKKQINTTSIFYDNYYEAQLARPSIDTLLQDIYGARSKLIVVVLCEKYQDKEWCGIEFRAVRDMIKKKEDNRIMFIRTDDGHVDGIFSIDGYIDGRKYTALEIANFIIQRISLLK